MTPLAWAQLLQIPKTQSAVLSVNRNKWAQQRRNNRQGFGCLFTSRSCSFSPRVLACTGKTNVSLIGKYGMISHCVSKVCPCQCTTADINFNIHWHWNAWLAAAYLASPLLGPAAPTEPHGVRPPTMQSFKVSAAIEGNRRDINKDALGHEVCRRSMNREILHCHVAARWGRKEKDDGLSERRSSTLYFAVLLNCSMAICSRNHVQYQL